MPCLLKCAKASAALALAVFALPSITPGQSSTNSSTSERTERGHYIQTNLVADPTQSVGKAPVTDPNLLNPWGLTRSPNGSPWWISNNDSGTSTLYAISGTPPTATPVNNFPADPHPDSNGNGINSPFNNFVMVPPPGFAPGTASAPTGIVFNGSHRFSFEQGHARRLARSLHLFHRGRNNFRMEPSRQRCRWCQASLGQCRPRSR